MVDEPVALLQSVEMEKTYMILSGATKEVYLDSERRGYLFFQEEEAAAFRDAHAGTIVSAGEYRKSESLLSYCYQKGALMLSLKRGTREEDCPLAANRVVPDFYNGDLNACLSLLKETKDMEYLKQAVGEKFLVPVRIRKADAAQEITYATVKFREQGTYSFLAFTDRTEYEMWAEKVSGWKPLMINLDIMYQIGNAHGYLINPMGNKLKLSGELLKRLWNSWKEAGEAKGA